MSSPTVSSAQTPATELTSAAGAIAKQVGRVVIGQSAVVEQVLISILARGHCLIQGVPGLAKTRLASALAAATSLSFSRIQFTPDLMPSDITGTDVLQEDTDGRRKFEFQRGPVFANLVLADEINRTPPKTQSALLQAMQERQVSVGNRTLDLPDPFIVLATQNPIEQEGTYPLPEAQLDRFMFMVTVDYPTREEELEVLKRTTGTDGESVSRVIDAAGLLKLQELVRQTPVGEHVYQHVLAIVSATRPSAPGSSDFVKHWLSWGAGPRAGQYMILAGKARALLQGRVHVTLADIEAIAPAVLRHRLIPNYNAEAEGINVEQIISKILTLIPRGTGDRLL